MASVPGTGTDVSPEERLPEVAHAVAIIMDGNGRWATEHGVPAPVLGREGVDHERVDPEVDRRFDDGPQRTRSRAMALGDRDPVLGRPATVAVHDDRDRVRDLGQVVLGADVRAGAWNEGQPG